MLNNPMQTPLYHSCICFSHQFRDQEGIHPPQGHMTCLCIIRERARKIREEEETKREREREKVQLTEILSVNNKNTNISRIRAGKEMMERKRIAEENERKRNLSLRKDEEKIMQKVTADKLERKRRLGLPTDTESPLDTKSKSVWSPSPASKAEEMGECLRSLRRNHKEEDPRVTKRAFETLLMIVRNAAKYPDEEKYRRIRLTNRLFQERVGRFKEAIEFMELCGFKGEEGSEFLYLSNHDADFLRLRDAAFTNPFFGLLSKESSRHK